MTNTHHTTRPRPAGIPGAVFPNLKRYIESHGFTAWYSGCREVAFAIPTYHCRWGGQADYHVIRVSALWQARLELGY